MPPDRTDRFIQPAGAFEIIKPSGPADREKAAAAVEAYERENEGKETAKANSLEE